MVLALLWSGGTDMVSRAYTESLEKTGTAEEGEGFRYNDEGSEGDTLGHRLFFPRISDGMGPEPRYILPLEAN